MLTNTERLCTSYGAYCRQIMQYGYSGPQKEEVSYSMLDLLPCKQKFQDRVCLEQESFQCGTTILLPRKMEDREKCHYRQVGWQTIYGCLPLLYNIYTSICQKAGCLIERWPMLSGKLTYSTNRTILVASLEENARAIRRLRKRTSRT